MIRCGFTLMLIFVVASFVTGCQSSYTAEMTIPLTTITGNEKNAKSVDAYDVLAEVEKIASQTGLKPYTPPSEETDLLDIADSDDLSDSSIPTIPTLQRTFKHPDFALYLTFTRQSDQIILVLNTPTEKPSKSEAALYNTLHLRLTTELPKELDIRIIEEIQK